MTAGDYRIGDALDELAAMPAESAAVVHLDDAWARPKRGNAFGVEYPTHGFERTAEIVAACWRVLQPGGWLIADADDWLAPRLESHLRAEYGDVTEDYTGGGYRRRGSVTLLSSDGTPDESTPGQYLSTGGYPVIFAHKGETGRRCTASARQLARRPQERYGWGSVKPVEPYEAWLDGLCTPGEHIVVPCAGTAPAALAAARLGLQWTAIDCEPEAAAAFERRRETETQAQQTVIA